MLIIMTFFEGVILLLFQDVHINYINMRKNESNQYLIFINIQDGIRDFNYFYKSYMNQRVAESFADDLSNKLDAPIVFENVYANV